MAISHFIGALEVHLFSRDVADTMQRIIEKRLVMEVNDFDRDLAGIEALQRKQSTLEHEVVALHRRIKEHESEAERLNRKHLDSSERITAEVSKST